MARHQQAYLQKDYALAARRFERAAGVCPKRDGLLLDLARARFMAQQPQSADRTLAELLKLDPRNSAALKLKGDAQYLLGNAVEAERLLQAAIEADPKNPEPRYALGRIYYQQVRLHQSVQQFRQVVGLDPSHYLAYDNMGLASTQKFATLFDGITRHSPEGVAWRARVEQVGFKQAVRERDGGEPIRSGREPTAGGLAQGRRQHLRAHSGPLQLTIDQSVLRFTLDRCDNDITLQGAEDEEVNTRFRRDHDRRAGIGGVRSRPGPQPWRTDCAYRGQQQTREKPATQPTQPPAEKPAAVEPTDEPETLELANVTAGLAELNSYKASFTMTFEGKEDGQPKTSTLAFTEEFVKDPAAKRTVITGFGAMLGSGAGTPTSDQSSGIESIEVGGKM